MAKKMEKNKINDLNEEEKELLRKYHEAKRKELLAQLSQIDSKIQAYGGDVQAGRNQAKIPFGGIAFPKLVKSVPERNMYVIEQIGRVATIGAIVQKYAQYDPSVKKEGVVVRKKYAHIYAALIANVNSGKLIRVKDDQGNYVYGLKTWVDETGDLKKEYK